MSNVLKSFVFVLSLPVVGLVTVAVSLDDCDQSSTQAVDAGTDFDAAVDEDAGR